MTRAQESRLCQLEMDAREAAQAEDIHHLAKLLVLSIAFYREVFGRMPVCRV